MLRKILIFTAAMVLRVCRQARFLGSTTALPGFPMWMATSASNIPMRSIGPQPV